MRRLGHASPAAALIYQHAADQRDSDIARALDAMISTTATGTTGAASPAPTRHARAPKPKS
jgi:hypothetical protein